MARCGGPRITGITIAIPTSAEDLHSVAQDGFWYSHVWWIFDSGNQNTDYNRIRDFARFPELRFLNKFYLLPPIMLGTVVFF